LPQTGGGVNRAGRLAATQPVPDREQSRNNLADWRQVLRNRAEGPPCLLPRSVGFCQVVSVLQGHGPNGPWPWLFGGTPMEKIPMTRAGFTSLDEELKVLKSVERPAVIRAIAEAREHGDLSENAEYHAAREKQSFIEGRVKELEAVLSRADVIDPSKFTGSVKFGAHVTLADVDSDEEKTYQIVGEVEANLEAGLLNIRSPLARALIGKDEGDTVEVRTPGGTRSYEIVTIRFA
jgi:transcription elongation factor GreA